MKKILSVLFLALIFVQCSAPKRVLRKNIPDSISIRVLLSESVSTLSFNIPVSLSAGSGNAVLIPANTPISFRRKGNEVSVDAKKIHGENIEIEPDLYSDLLSFNGKRYRGSFILQPDKNGIYLINRLNIDDYIKSVMYGEMGVASRPEDYEALKAFAVCVRNYTMMKLNENRNRSFDVYADVRDQVYSGFDSERDYTTQAVNDTKGLVLTFDGAPAKVFYFASCGGSTENAEHVFSLGTFQYMEGISDGHSDPYCSISPSYGWKESYSADEIVKMLRAAKYIDNKDYSLADMEIKSRFSSGRVNELQIELSSSNGDKSVTLTGNPIRSVIRSHRKNGLLRSTMFSMEIERVRGRISNIVLTGKGNGHGVGFCQWGSIGRSRDGQDFNDILSSYFPGTGLEKL